MKRVTKIGIILFIIFLMTMVCFAKERDGGGKNLSIKENEIIRNDLFFVGDVINNMGTIQGDVFSTCYEFMNKGEITGDLIMGALDLRIEGTIGGDARILSGNAYISGEVSKNITALTNALVINGAVDGNVVAYGGSNIVNGIIGGNYRVKSGNIVINGIIKGDVTLEGDEIKFGPKAKIEGKLIYVSNEKVNIPKGMVIGGIERRPINKSLGNIDRLKNRFSAVETFLRILGDIGYFLIAYILYVLFKEKLNTSVGYILENKWRTLGIGILGVIGIPIISILFIISLIGIPLGIITLVLYGLLVYMAKIPVAQLIGNFIFKEKQNTLLSLITGLVVVVILCNIPYLRIFTSLVMISSGLGAYISMIYFKYKLS